MIATANRNTIPATREGLYYVTRDGRQKHLSWSKLSDAERASQIQAEQRAQYADAFGIYS